MMRLWIEGNNQPCEFNDDELAEAIIRSPTCIYKVERQYAPFSDAWADVTSFYMDYINARKRYWTERKRKEMKIKSAPRYSPGDVIDLSYKHGGLPNRILVTCAFWRREDKQWMYKVFMESTGQYSVLDETFIASRESKKTSPAYKNPAVLSRIAEGWRFCGNFDTDTATANGKLIAENEMVKRVRLWPAINYNNKYVQGQMGIWIIYSNTIDNNGNNIVDVEQFNTVVDIK